MLFNSDLFLFVFLPITLLVFYGLGALGKVRLAIVALILASLVYYSWWNPVYLPLIMGSMLVNYCIGLPLQEQGRSHVHKRILLVLGIAINLGLLGYFKYANFFVDSYAALTGSSVQLAPIVLPLAISFFTFQQIAYLADSYQGKVRETNLLRYSLFVTFFPQLIAGPIVHHKEMMPQFAARSIGRFRLDDLIIGMVIFFLGLFKKVVLADSIAPFANRVFGAALGDSEIGFADAWLGTLAYTLQIYFDFSGYSDMAVGLGRMFGINLPLNFNSPYKATGIIDFWRRWHMTLSRFLRDYLYIPLGGNRLGPGRRYINMMVVMLLGGLWHGAGWNFVVWGGLHGAYLIVNHGWRTWRGDQLSDSSVVRMGSNAITFGAVMVAWVFFRAESFAAAWKILTAMLTPATFSLKLLNASEVLVWLIPLLGVIFLLPNTQQFMRTYMTWDQYRIRSPRWLAQLRWQPIPVFAALMAVVSAVTIMSLWQPSEFIYYQF